MSYYKKTRPGQNGRNKFVRKNPKPQGQGAYIHPSKFVNRASGQIGTTDYQAKHQFSDFAFCAELQANIQAHGYKTPSAIQDQTIALALDGQDILGLANTGTGKTAAFLLPLINKMFHDKSPFSAVIIAPTRELAEQIDDQFRIFAAKMGLYSALLVGGRNIDRQMTMLRRGPNLVIATPGRIMDLINRRKVSLTNVKTFILDEADRMLDMGFISDIRKIAQMMPAAKQTLFFSATITPRVRQLTEEFLIDPQTVSVVTADTSDRVNQDVIKANSREEKMEKLLGLLCDDSFDKVLLFGKTKFGVQRICDHLCRQEISSVAIHGNKSQSQRQKALNLFKNGKARVMVATDVAARGLDIPNVSHVINFDQPATYEDYVHRIGRTGRGDAIGSALTFIEKR